MVVRIVIAGESQCEMFADVCLIADYLSQNLPDFSYERIVKPVLEWEAWLFKINQKHKWHHIGSPLVWKEVLMKGSKPLYIGGAPEFLEYCHSYYKFDTFISAEKFDGLARNFAQFEQKLKVEKTAKYSEIKTDEPYTEEDSKTNIVVCISGAANNLTMHLISGLLEIAVKKKSISKIYIHDPDCSQEFMDIVERDCSYVATDHPTKVVKYVEKIGVALTHTDLLIIMNHVPFTTDMAIGDWLFANKKLMTQLSFMINASASRKINILFPNLGPACYNATVLCDLVNIQKKNIVVATSDLGLEISPVAAEIAEISMRTMFCPPVWGFVGINHLVDIRTTVHKYNSFEPYNRYTKVKNSSLTIGSLTPVLRTMEYLMHFDDSLWKKVAENKTKFSHEQLGLNKALAALNVVKLWLFDRNPENIISLGVQCNGSFGLHFEGIFSQPCRLVNEQWEPASDYMLPKDPQVKLNYLVDMAKRVMKLQKGELPKIIPFYPCSCKKKLFKKKLVW